MAPLEIIDIGREALWTLMLVGAPVMAVALIVGLLISLFQALTQIQEMTLTFVPKIIAIFFTLMLVLPFMFQTLADFNERMMERIVDPEYMNTGVIAPEDEPTAPQPQPAADIAPQAETVP